MRRREIPDFETMSETIRDDGGDAQGAQTKRTACPQCASPVRVVTAVTVKTLGTEPRTVLVTYRCTSPSCLFKYPLPKLESELNDEERAVWR